MLKGEVNPILNPVGCGLPSRVCVSDCSVGHLHLSGGTLQLGDLGQHCLLVGQNVVNLLGNLILKKKKINISKQQQMEHETLI